MDGQQGYSGVPSDGQHGHPPSSGYVRIPYASIGPLHQVPPPPVVNYQPAYHLSHPQHQGVQGVGGGINLNGPAMAAAMNAGVGVMPTAPLLPMPAPPSVPANFYLANNNNPFSAGAGFAYTTPAPQPVPVMTDPEMPYPEVPFDPRSPPPFADRAQLQLPRPHGVLKIENIPYTISIPEMQQFICKYIPQSHLIEPHVAGYPIHIIMERSTGKTMDCYVEIVAPHIAARDWEHAFDPKQMRIPKIGQRNVEVTLSNQSELMKDMFPRANCIHFKADQFGAPVLVPNRDIFSSGYKGFMTNEELTCIVRHAEYPQRSQFANRSMQRTFESMISTLYKFPWYSVKLYTIRQTQQMFDAYKKQLDVLIVKVDSSRGTPREVGLDNKLLMDFVFAGLNAPGFSERQRAEIVESSKALACGFQISKHARYWPFTTLSTLPAHLSDQDVGMWLEILNVGMGVMEAQNRKLIGIEPYLEVIRDPEGYILFVPSETALDLKRGQFSVLEKRVMNDMMQLGWQSYMRQMGVESPTHMQHPGMPFFSNNNFTVGVAHVDPVDPFTGAGSSNTGPGGPPNNNNGEGSGTGGNDNVLDIQNGHDLWFDDDEYNDEHEFEGELSDNADEPNKASSDNVDDPEKALQAMRDVLKQVSQAPPAKQQARVHKQSGFDADTTGLAASLQNIELSGGNNGGPGPTIVGSLPPQRPARASTVVDHPFNPETPAFEPPPGWKQRHHHTPTNSDSTLGTGTVFGGSGLGNGDFASPQRISTARNNNNNKGKGKEPAATAARSGPPAAATGIRLQPAAPIFTRPPPTVAFGRVDAVAAQPALFQVPNNNGRERRGVTIRSASSGGSSLATLQRTSALESGATVTAGGGGPDVLLTQSPGGGAQNDGNSADSLDEFLDDLFGETTSQADRMAMRTPTPSTTPLIAPVTPLRRTVGRVPSAGIGPVEDDYDDGEVVNNSVPADEPSSSPSYINYSDRSSNSGAAPVTGPPEYRGPGSGWEGYSPISQTDLSPSRVPRRLTPGFGTNLVGSPYPVRMTRSEVTAEKRSTRLDFQRLNLHIDDTIDEEETES